MSGKVCVVGSFMMDLVAYAPRRPYPGETLVGSSFGIHLGGKGYNQAVAASRAGAQVSFVGAVGKDDFGESFIEGLRSEGIDASHVIRNPRSGTGVGLPVVEPDGQNSIVIVPQANMELTVGDIEDARQSIEDADVLLLQFELPLPCVVAAAQIAHDAGTKVVLNPAPFVPVPSELIELVDVFVPNEGEGRAAVNSDSDASASEVLHRLTETYDGIVVLTLGESGVAFCDPGSESSVVPSFTFAKVVDTVGAGDTFCGALGARLAAKDRLHDAIRFANAAAGIAVTRHGGAGSTPTAAEVDAVLSSTSILTNALSTQP